MSDIINYKILKDDNLKFDNSFKLVVIGDSGVGKSSLTKKATTNIFENEYSPTIGFEYFTFKVCIKEKNIRLQIWDTCGQETYRSLITSFYHNSSLAILVYSINSIESFNSLENWLNDIKMNSNPVIKIFLIGNKSDLEELREVETNTAEEFCRNQGINLFMEASAKTGFNTEKIFVDAANILLDEYEKIMSIRNLGIKDENDSYILEQDGETDVNPRRITKKKCC